MLVSISRTEYFEAAHLLPGHEKGCGSLHGHSYRLQVEITGPQTEPWGMIMDYNDLKQAIKEVMPDHKYLHYEGDPRSEDFLAVIKKYNMRYDTFPCATSAENMAPILMNRIEDYIKNTLNYKDIQVTKLVLNETKNSECVVRKEYKI